MNLSDEVANLDRLHEKGVLSNQQYHQAKAKLMMMQGKHDTSVASEIDDLQRQHQLQQLDQAWALNMNRI